MYDKCGFYCADMHVQYACLDRTFILIVYGMWVVSEYISCQLHALTEASLQFPKSKVQTYKYHFAGGYGDVLFQNTPCVYGCRFSIYSLFMNIQNLFQDIHYSIFLMSIIRLLNIHYSIFGYPKVAL